MSQASISPALRQAVADHFDHRCCYCFTSEQIVGAEFTIDHIVPQSLGGASTEDNLCLACWRCNLIKRDRIAAADPASGSSFACSTRASSPGPITSPGRRVG